MTRIALSAEPLAVAAEALVAGCIFFCAYALGGVALWAVAAFVGLAALACASATLASSAAGERLALPRVTWALVALAAAVGAQRVPMPPGLLRLLAPSSYALFDFTLGPHRAFPAWRPLSLDPPATAGELAKILGYLCLFVAAAQVARHRRARRRLAAYLGLLGFSLAALGFLHQLFGLTAFMGIDALPRAFFVSPFVNKNNLASALELAACVQLGLMLRSEDRRVAFVWGGAFLATGAAVLLTYSRGGAVSLVAGLLVFTALVGLRGGGPHEQRRRYAALAIVLLIGALSVAAYLQMDPLLERLGTLVDRTQLAESKVGIWPSMVPLVRDHWLTGVGRGAFGVAYPHYQDQAFEVTFLKPENVILQMTSELGVPLGLGILVLLAGAWARTARRRDLSATEAGLLAGLFAVGLHDFGDFGLELTGVAAAAIVAFAALEVRPGQVPTAPIRGGLVPLLAALVLAPWGLAASADTAMGDSFALQAKVGTEPAGRIAELATAALRRHPADYLIELAPAIAALQAQPPLARQALYWAGRAMYLAPHNPWPHRIAAQALFALGKRDQGMLELQLAFGAVRTDPTFAALLRYELKTPEELARATPPDGPDFASTMDVLADRPRDAIRVGEIGLAAINLEDPGILSRLGGDHARLGEHAAALAYAQRWRQAAPEDLSALAFEAGELFALGRAGEGEQALRQGLLAHPNQGTLAIPLASRLIQTKRYPEAHQLLSSIVDDSVPARQWALAVDAQAWESQGFPARVLADLRESARLDPRNPEGQYAIARSLVRQGDLRQALEAIDAGLALDSPEGRVQRETWRKEVRAQEDAQRRDLLLREAQGPQDGAE